MVCPSLPRRRECAGRLQTTSSMSDRGDVTATYLVSVTGAAPLLLDAVAGRRTYRRRLDTWSLPAGLGLIMTSEAIWRRLTAHLRTRPEAIPQVECPIRWRLSSRVRPIRRRSRRAISEVSETCCKTRNAEVRSSASDP